MTVSYACPSSRKNPEMMSQRCMTSRRHCPGCWVGWLDQRCGPGGLGHKTKTSRVSICLVLKREQQEQQAFRKQETLASKAESSTGLSFKKRKDSPALCHRSLAGKSCFAWRLKSEDGAHPAVGLLCLYFFGGDQLQTSHVVL